VIVTNDLRNTDKSRFVVKGVQFAAKAANTGTELRMSRAFRQTTLFPTGHEQTCSKLVISLICSLKVFEQEIIYNWIL